MSFITVYSLRSTRLTSENGQYMHLECYIEFCKSLSKKIWIKQNTNKTFQKGSYPGFTLNVISLEQIKI